MELVGSGRGNRGLTEKYFIMDFLTTLSVESEDLMVKSLPLSLFEIRIIFPIRVISSINQPKIVGCLYDISHYSLWPSNWGTHIIKSPWNCSWIILLEVPRDCRIFDILSTLRLSHHNQEGHHNSGNEQERSVPHDEFVFLENLKIIWGRPLLILTQDDLS
jgi:hypothetical protein